MLALIAGAGARETRVEASLNRRDLWHALEPLRLRHGDIAIVKIGIYIPISAFIDLNFERTHGPDSRFCMICLRQLYGLVKSSAENESFDLAK